MIDTLIAVLILLAGVTPAAGEASWYDDGSGLYGAVHTYRWGAPRYPVQVCRQDDPGICVTVTVRDYMDHETRAIDLSPDAFAKLWPDLPRRSALRRGVVDVTVKIPRTEAPCTRTHS